MKKDNPNRPTISKWLLVQVQQPYGNPKDCVMTNTFVIIDEFIDVSDARAAQKQQTNKTIIIPTF